MTKLRFPVHFAYITGLVVSAGAAIYFGIALKLSLVPLKTDWGDFATWLGAVGTIAGFAVATVTLWHNDKMHRQAEADERIAQSKKVAITSTMEVEPAPAPWKAYKLGWTDGRAFPGMPTVEEQEYLDKYPGPWVGKVTYTAQNGTPYPLFNPVVTVDLSELQLQEPPTEPRKIRLPALIPGSTTTGKLSLDLKARPGEDMVPDLVELDFTDVWKDRWRTTSQGCEKAELPDEKPADAG